MTDYVSAVTRQNIDALRALNESLSRSTRRLASGQKHAGLVENAGAVTTAQNLRGRSAHLSTVIDRYATARGAVQTASAGLSSIAGLVGELRAVGKRMIDASPAEIGTPATRPSPPTPPSGPQTLTVYTRQIATNVDGALIAGSARTAAERAILGPWNRNEFTRGGTGTGNGNAVRDQIFSAKDRAHIPHVTEPPSSYSSVAQKNDKVDRLRFTATDGTTTKTQDWYFGHAGSASLAVVDGDLAEGSDDLYTVKHLVQAINRDLGDYVQASVTSNGRMRFDVAGDVTIELVERSPGPASSTKPWDSLTNLFGPIQAGADGDVATDLDGFEFGAGTGSSANIGTGNNAGNYEITFTPGTRPTGGFTAVTPPAPGTPGIEGTGLLGRWDDLTRQIEAVARDAGFDGLNLLQGQASEIQLSERADAPRLRIPGAQVTLHGLGLPGSNDGFGSVGEIETRLAELDGAATSLERLSLQLNVAKGILSTRETFTGRLMSELDGGADSLTLIDASEEGAKLLALRTRIELASSALSLGVGTDRNVVDMLSDGASRIDEVRGRSRETARRGPTGSADLSGVGGYGRTPSGGGPSGLDVGTKGRLL